MSGLNSFREGYFWDFYYPRKRGAKAPRLKKWLAMSEIVAVRVPAEMIVTLGAVWRPEDVPTSIGVGLNQAAIRPSADFVAIHCIEDEILNVTIGFSGTIKSPIPTSAASHNTPPYNESGLIGHLYCIIKWQYMQVPLPIILLAFRVCIVMVIDL